MKVSYQWLQTFIPKLDASAEDVGERITMHTAELEEIIETNDQFKSIFLGKLVDTKPHPKSEKLSIGIFDLGSQGKKQVLYGKVHPVQVGEILPIAIETTLASGIKVGTSEIAGEKSEGMITDNSEMGMKSTDLLRFTDDSLIGKTLLEAIKNADDQLFDIDNKSLTHRPDLMGHRGFAREVAAIYNHPLILPEPAVAIPQEGTEIAVDIQHKDCRRFCAMVMDNIQVEPSSMDKVFRLENLDIRAISNMVDVTNLMMLEFGQPMHAFDAAKVTGSITVRLAKPGEKILALDDEEYELSDQDLIVADDEKVLSIAGIMGGMASGVTDQTTSIILECANFDPVRIRKTSQRLGLRSDSSMRFEKSLCPNKCKKVILAATEMVQESCPQAKLAGPLTDQYPRKLEKVVIDLNPDLVRSHSGIDIDDKTIIRILERLDFHVNASDPKNLVVTVPSFRATKDVGIAEDLIEEVVRLYGLPNIKAILPKLPTTPPRQNHIRGVEWRIRESLAAQGFFEVYNYNFVNQADEKFTETDSYVTIQNPLSAENTQLRKTLISNLVRNLEAELRSNKHVQLFELGKVFEPTNETLPDERLNGALFAASIDGDENQLFYNLKEEFNNFVRRIGIKTAPTHTPSENPAPFAHPSKSADISIGDTSIGNLAVLHPKHLPFKQAQIAFVEFDVATLSQIIKDQSEAYIPISNFPSVHRDISIVVKDRVLIGDIQRLAQSISPILKKIELFDEYVDEEKLGKGLKNLAFHLSFQSAEKTFSEGEIDETLKQITDLLEKELGAQLRMAFDQL